VDDAADGVGTVQAAGGTTEYLYPFDGGRVHRIPVHVVAERAIYANSIHQDQGVTGFSPTQHDARLGMRAALGSDLHTWLASQYLGDAIRAGMLEFLAVDYRDIPHHIFKEFGCAAG